MSASAVLPLPGQPAAPAEGTAGAAALLPGERLPHRPRRGSFRQRRARIVCTLGPATQSPEAIAALVEAGMDVARLNLSHGTWEQHAAVCRRVREASDASRRAVGVLADLQGPKIRLGSFAGGAAVLETGSRFTIATAPGGGGGAVDGTSQRAVTTYDALARDVATGDTLLIDDGRVRLRVLSSRGAEVDCEVVDGGLVSDHKGLSLPGVEISAPALTARDADDLRFALALGVDMVALSFVRRPQDIEAVLRVMDAAGRRVPVIAKLEKPEAVADLEAVVAAFDGIMVARGDLGVEMALERLPLVQKHAIQLARSACKPVVVATQMLESMTHEPRPTRAEVCDVANAVLDGADALMLSAETSVGAHPIEAVAMMARIVATTEDGGIGPLPAPTAGTTPGEAIATAAPTVAESVDAQALVAFTETGLSARRLARHRSPIPVLAFTPNSAVRSRLTLTWGVETFVVAPARHTDEMVVQVERAMLDLGRCAPGDLLVIVAGSAAGEAGSTNMLRVHRVRAG